MSDYTDLFTSFYNQFILRDLLSMILPGFIVIFVFSKLFYEQIEPSLWIVSIIPFLSLIIILSLSYLIGILFIGLSDTLRIFKTYYTPTANEQRKKVKGYYERLSATHNQKAIKQFSQIRERYIIFMQTCGNFGWACIISIITIGVTHPSVIFTDLKYSLIIFLILLLFSGMGYYKFKKYLKNWDDLILNIDEDSCTRIFGELRDKGLISLFHEIEASNEWKYFQAGLRTIHYNLKMNELDENSIRICLLHEEGHIRFNYKTFIFLGLLLVGLLFDVIVIFPFNLLLGILSIGLIIFILFFVGRQLLLMEEYRCDEFASNLIQENYDTSILPSKILEKALENMQYSSLSAFTHPPIQQRVKNIADKVDKK